MLGSRGVEVGQVWGDQELILEVEDGDEARVMWRVQSSKGVCVETRSEAKGQNPALLAPLQMCQEVQTQPGWGIICSPFPSTPDPGPKAGEGMLAPHCTSLADAIGGKVGVQFPQRAPLCPFLLKRDRGAWQVRGGGLPLLTAALLRGCTHDVLREPPKTVSSAAESREPWAC